MKKIIAILMSSCLIVQGQLNINSPIFNAAILKPSSYTFSWATLSHYWTMDETAGNSRVDIINAVNLDEFLGPVPESASGIHSNCTDFISNPELLLSSSSITLAANSSLSLWIKINSNFGAGASEFILLSNTYNIYTYDDGGNPFLHADQNGVSIDIAISFSTWYNIVITVDNSGNVNISLNNSNILSASGGAVISPDYLNVGYTFVYDAFDGLIDEIAIFDSVLNASDVSYLYNSGAGHFYP